MSRNAFGRGNKRVAVVAVMVAALGIGAPVAASAEPTFGSSTGSGLIDDPIGTITGGVRILSEVIGGAGSSGAGSSGNGAPTQNCNEATVSGGAGVPDNIEVFYQGGKVFESGYIGDDLNEGTGSAVVRLPPGAATTVLVRVSGPNGTNWTYTVRC
ncbi:hypothetical protein [Rhodococcoides kroppenstedtii]|uniref:hypothetical protein n=1 Tax=Rhodococcoides kroppenstedtii TaxID=293050 RepID=UPI0028E5CFCB|nr:hypothetical protein [Rhodococcus kroppenstedtii]